MPLISGRHDGKAVKFDVSIIGVSFSSQSAFLENQRQPVLNGTPVRALIDSGATHTTISMAAARNLRLRPIGKRDIVTANGQRRARYYHFNIGLFDASGHGPRTVYILRDLIYGNELNTDGFMFDILPGMDVIRQGDLTIRRNNTFSFEF